MLALVIVRGGVVPLGADEVVAECGGAVVIAVDDAGLDAADLAVLDGVARRVDVVELGAFDIPAWSDALAVMFGDEIVVLPASADGRDLAPRLAAARRSAFHANALRVDGATAELIVGHGLALADVQLDGPAVVTMSPGARAVEHEREPFESHVAATREGASATVAGRVTTVELLPADAATVDLAEAPRIIAGGAGLDDPSRFEQLGRIAATIGASVGTTRVVTDRGWLTHQRQIGTTGVVVDPQLYVAFAVSGAVQHTSGIGTPKHIVSVNVDPSCPMMQLADVAIVSDANAVLDALEALLRPVEDVA